MDRKAYEEDLARRQKEHLDAVARHVESLWQPCAHDQCTECVGTGVKLNGSMCVHLISCNCPKHLNSMTYITASGSYTTATSGYSHIEHPTLIPGVKY